MSYFSKHHDEDSLHDSSHESANNETLDRARAFLVAEVDCHVNPIQNNERHADEHEKNLKQESSIDDDRAKFLVFALPWEAGPAQTRRISWFSDKQDKTTGSLLEWLDLVASSCP